jgi:hypothetical protein
VIDGHEGVERSVEQRERMGFAHAQLLGTALEAT